MRHVAAAAMVVPTFVLGLAAVVATLVSALLFMLFAAWSVTTALALVVVSRSESVRVARAVAVYAGVSCAATTLYAALTKGSELLWFAAIPFGIAAVLLTREV